MIDLQYPVGLLSPVESLTPEQRTTMIQTIEDCPIQVRAAVAALPEGGLDRPYRPGGWTARQVVHHLADSHMNSYVRFRLALTEDGPTIKPYDEAKWAELADAKSASVALSMQLLDVLHARWVLLLRSIPDEGWSRTLLHPEHGVKDVDWLLQVYEWHSRHHVGHLRLLS